MHSERDVLVKRVFPELRERLERHRIHLIDIDLRWGVTREQAEHMRALELCLEFIDQCRPFFLGILGARYGYVPKELPNETLNKFPWLLDHGDGSITALEIIHGALRTERMHGRCFFYFRDPAFLQEMPALLRELADAESKVAAEKLAALKSRIAKAGLPSPPLEGYPCRFAGIRLNWQLIKNRLADNDRRLLQAVAAKGLITRADYDQLDASLQSIVARHGALHLVDLDAFAQRVREDLWSGIRAEFPEVDESAKQVLPPEENSDAWLEEQADQMARFVESRTRVYAKREELQRQLLEYVTGADAAPFVLLGRGGSGKSAALAQLSEALLLRKDQIAFVACHFVGASAASSNLASLLRRLCQQLKDRFRPTWKTPGYENEDPVPLEVPEDTESLPEGFRRFLDALPKDSRVVIIIDALNELGTLHGAQELHWLPSRAPDNVRFILSCSSDSLIGARMLERLRRRGCHLFEVSTLTLEERREIIQAVPSLSVKALDSGQIAAILANSATDNPLYLRVALEELKGFGSFEQLDDWLRALPSGEEAIYTLFDQMLERLEREFDQSVVRRVLSLLSISRDGLSEREITALIDDLDGKQDLFPVLRQLRPYLFTRGSTIDFYHQALRLAAQRRYCGTAGQESSSHERLARYFQSRGTTPRALAELPFHLTHCKAWVSLERLLTDLDFVEAKCRAGMADGLLEDYHRIGAGRLAPGLLIVTAREHQGRLHVRCPSCCASISISEDFMDGELICPACARRLKTNAFFLRAEEASNEVPGIKAGATLAEEPACSDTQREFGEFVRRELHVLKSPRLTILGGARSDDGPSPLAAPHIAFQQAMNWPDSSAPARVATQMRARKREPWIRHLHATQRATPDVLTIAVDFEIYACAFSPDGNRITAAGGVSPALWDAWTGVREPIFGQQKMGLDKSHGCAFSPDGRHILTASDALSLWNLESGAPEAQLGVRSWLNTPGRVPCAYSPGGSRFVAFGYGDDVHDAEAASRGWIWDARAYLPIAALKDSSEAIQCCSYSPDGRLIAAGDAANRAWLWNATTGELIGSWKLPEIDWKSVTAPVEMCATACSFSPDGKHLILSVPNGLIHYDVDELSGTQLKNGYAPRATLLGRQNRQILDIAYSPDGRRLVSVSFMEIKLWDMERFTELARLPNHGDTLRACTFSPDAQYFVTGADRELKMWDADAACSVKAKQGGHSFPVTAIERSPDGRNIVSLVSTSMEKPLKLWSSESGSLVSELDISSDEVRRVPYACAWSPDGSFIAIGGKWPSIFLMHLKAPGGKGVRLCDQTMSCAFRTDGGQLAAGQMDGKVCLYELPGTLDVPSIELAAHKEEVYALDYSPDGKRLASASRDGSVAIWDVVRLIEDGARATEEFAMLVASEPVSRDPFFYLGHDRDLRTKPIMTLRRDEDRFHGVPVAGCKYSPDGRRILSWSGIDGFVLWDAIRGISLADATGYVSAATACDFLPSGRYFVSAHWNQTVTIWDAHSIGIVATVRLPSRGRAIKALPDGTTIALGCLDGFVRYLQLQDFDDEPARATPARLLLRDRAKWGNHPTVACARCAERFRVPMDALQIIRHFNDGIPSREAPCSCLPEKAWHDPALNVLCPKCTAPLRLNPFIVGREEPEPTRSVLECTYSPVWSKSKPVDVSECSLSDLYKRLHGLCPHGGQFLPLDWSRYEEPEHWSVWPEYLPRLVKHIQIRAACDTCGREERFFFRESPSQHDGLGGQPI